MSHSVSFSSTYESFCSNQNFSEAEIQISKKVIDSRSSVAFKCTRHVSWINQKSAYVFFNAIKGSAKNDLKTNDNEFTRGFLSESRRESSDRAEHKNYENFIINKILDKINSQSEFHVTLTVCGSGKLLSEEILLFRLIHELKDRQGLIELNLIDSSYQELNESAKSGIFLDSVGEKKHVQQFLHEMSQCLPESIQIEGQFFDSAKHYVELVNLHVASHYDFLIGTNPNENPDFLILENQFDEHKTRSAILTPKSEIPIRRINSNQSKNNLEAIYSVHTGGDFRLKEDKTHPVKTIAAISMAILLGIAYLKGPQH